MADAATLTSWLEGLGFDVKDQSSASGQQLTVVRGDEADPRVTVRRADPGAWEIIHHRHVPASTLNTDWHAPWDTDPPAVVVGQAARDVASGFPMVESDAHDEGGDVTVRFHAPVFDDGLTRQAFVLTASAVLKAADVFDLVLARRSEEISDWREFEATSAQRKQEQQDVIRRLAEAPAPSEATEPVAPIPPSQPSDATLPGAAWAATHVLTRRADAWAQPDPAGARAGTLKRRVQVQVVERQGDWARVVTSNGWSGWIAARDLKER